MSSTLNDISAKSLSSLLAEYTKKIDGMSSHARALRKTYHEGSPEERSFTLELSHANEQRFQRLHSHLTFLAQEASQWIEHGDLDDPARLELKMRLADFEAQLDYSRNVMDAVNRELSRA